MAHAPNEIEQEARRVLRRLIAGESYLVPDDAGFRMVRRGVPVKGRAGKVASGMADAFLERGWIRRGAGKLSLTEEGMLFLRRAGASSDPARAQHQILVKHAIPAADGGIETVTVNQAESPLGWLLRRKGSGGKSLISKEEYAAGERLREDFTRAQLNPRVTSDWTLPVNDLPRASYGMHDIAASALSARKQVREALQAVGPGLAEPLVAVCCRLEGLEAIEAAFAWPQRAGKIVLKIALDRLARHYGFIRENARPALLRAWRAEEETGAA